MVKAWTPNSVRETLGGSITGLDLDKPPVDDDEPARQINPQGGGQALTD
jgi:hypothetical protein